MKGKRFLQLERLEDRCVPATCSWTNGGGTGFWNDQRNWNTGTVPGTTDTVDLNLNSLCNLQLGYGITSATIAQLNVGGGSINLGGNTLNVTGGGTLSSGSIWTNSTHGTLNLSGGTFTWSGGNLGYYNGTIEQSGTVNVNGATMNVTNTSTVTLGLGVNVGTGGVASTLLSPA